MASIGGGTRGAYLWGMAGEAAVRRILVVDDDDALREVVTVALTRDGHTVDGACDGTEALALPSISTGSNAWMPRRCSVGARLRSTGCSRITSSSTSHTSGRWSSTISFACLIVATRPRSSSLL